MIRRISLFTFLAGLCLWAFTAPSSGPLLALFAIGLHEAGHLFAALLLGIKPSGMTADSLGVRLLFRDRFLSYGSEILLCLMGPGFNLISAGIALLLGANPHSFFVSVSLALALLNLLPISGFDGGRCLICLLSVFLSPRAVARLGELCSFLFLFALWCASVYPILRSGKDLSLFFFSTSLFFRIFCQKNPV